MSKVLFILVIALLFEASGVVFLSKGLKQIGEVEKVNAAEIIRIVKRGATNPFILLGVLLEAIFFGALLYLLSQADVSLIWPLTSLGFVLTTISAKLILHEHVSATRWLGVLLIVMGAGLISWTEKRPEKTAAAPSGQSQASARP
jgi:drug/metabolite transporter (DMT)-like permease